LLDRRPQCAEDLVDLERIANVGEPIEIHDRTAQAIVAIRRVEWPARHREDATHGLIGEKLAHDLAADQSGGPQHQNRTRRIVHLSKIAATWGEKAFGFGTGVPNPNERLRRDSGAL